MKTKSNLRIGGGWGYDNIGDEAILAGYLETLQHYNPSVISVDRERTMNAQRSDVDVRFCSEFSLPLRSSGSLLLGGGGYLNGHWTPEIQLKLARLVGQKSQSALVGHGLELRNLTQPLNSFLTRRLFRHSVLGVRDIKSAAEAEALHLPRATVLPDAISLLAPHIGKYLRDIPEVKGKVLVNLLDISRRNDANEAEVDLVSWKKFCQELVRALGDRAIGLVVGGGDRTFLNQLPGLTLVSPKTVRDLVSLIHSSDGLVSVRMHPTLIGTILGTPTVGVPYCGKVRPTLEAIGVQSVLLTQLEVHHVLAKLEGRTDFTESWKRAANVNAEWLESAVESTLKRTVE